MALLDFEKYSEYEKVFPNKPFQLLQYYGPFFNASRLKNELSYLYSSTEFKTKLVLDLNQQLRADGLTEALPEITKLCSLILTIPVTSASAERSFSAFRRIHAYQRNTQGQTRLSDLSIISIATEFRRKIYILRFHHTLVFREKSSN